MKIEDTVSRIFAAAIGLPQGSSLAPLLFKFYVHDIPQPNGNARAYGFADDLLVVAWGRPKVIQKKMQRYLQRLQAYYEHNGITVNVEKSRALTVTGTLNRMTRQTRAECKLITVAMNGIAIPAVSSLKYLGIVINEKCSFVENVSNAIKKISCTMGAMKKVLTNKNLLTAASKLAFYKAAIRPVMSYAFPMWSGVSSHQMERLRVAERKFIRWTRGDHGRRDGYRYLNSSVLYKEANVVRINAWMTALYLKQFNKFQISEKPWVAELFSERNQARSERNEKYPAPEYLFHLNTREPLFNQVGCLLHFNKRVRDGGEVYVTAQ